MQRSIGTTKLMFSIFLLLPWLATINVSAQILPAGDGTGTITQQDRNQINISGGQTSPGGGNLFHSFSQFNVNPSQVANFISTPNVQNILGRIDGSNASFINGTLQVTGGNSNLFLMNPAGFVFGANASLNLPASFTTTTATGINFANGQFSAIGNNNYTNLVGNPTAFVFGSTQPGAIVNGGNLTVNPGQNIDLIGGTVISTGTVNAPNGNINIAAVPGTSLVRISQPGNLLSLEVPISGTTNFTPVALPQLLTGSGIPGVTVTGNNVTLDRGNIPIKAGDAVVNNLNSGTATVAARNNLNIIGSNIQTTGDVTLRAQDTVAIKDTQQNPLNIVVDGRLLIQGDRAIDIFAFNNPNTNISSTGDLTLRSSNTVGGDAYFNTGGDFKIEQLDGKLGGLFSPYDPIIRANGDVSFASYQGASLHILAGGNVSIPGTITITQPDSTISLTNSGNINNGLTENFTVNGIPVSINGRTVATVDIRAGVSANSIGTPGNFGSFSTNGTPRSSFTPSSTASPSGSAITIGSIDFIDNSDLRTTPRTFVSLTNQYAPNSALAAGDINVTGEINTINVFEGPESSGNITIVGRNNVNVNKLTTGITDNKFTGSINTGNITVNATGNINAIGLITTENPSAGTTGSGNISLTSTNGTITTDRVSTQINNGNSTNSKAGNIDLTAAGAIVTKELDARSLTPNLGGTSGNITLTSTNGSIDTTNVLTAGGTIDIKGKTNVNAVQLNTGITSGNITTNTGNITVSTDGNINVTGLITTENQNAVTTGSGNISLKSTNGTITTDRVTTQINRGNSTTSKAGDIDLTAAGAIATKDLDARSLNTVGGSGGNISLVSNNSSIDTGNILTVVDSPKGFPGSTFKGNGGSVNATAKTNINTGVIVTTADRENGGNVTLNSGNNTQVGYINTSSGTNGGAVNVTANKFFRATDSTSVSLSPTPTPSANPSAVPVSIYTNGNTASGAITIRHGGNGITPFIVGDATTNGTKAAIVSSDNNQINPTQSFLSSYTQGNIQIITATPPIVEPPISPICPPSCGNPPQIPTVVTDTGNPQIKPTIPDERVAINFPSLQEFDSNITTRKVQTILKSIESNTGVKPAIIYVVFAPPNLDIDLAKDINNISQLERDSFQLELVMVTPSGLPVRKPIPITRQKLIAVAKEFRAQVSDPKSSTAFLPSAQQLYQWLIAPIEPELQKQKIQNLVFITDSGLRALPVAALHDGKQFLVERYSVGSMPSISLTDTRYVDIRNAKVLAMGAENTPDQRPLPAVPIELKTISGAIWTGKSFENEDFTATNLVNQRQQQPYGILHLATHGDFKAGGPENSYIQFKNERLGLDRLRQLKLNNPPVELMVLSACRTAVGDEDAELGFAGLANRAGVKSAMGSIWYVSDEGTLGLMTSFYRNLKTAPIKAEALRQAQVAMLQGKVRLENGKLITAGDNVSLPPSLVKLGNVTLTHPFYWSGFTIVGNPW